MIRITPAMRISLGMASLTVSLLLLGKTIGLVPDWTREVIESRKIFSETMAVQFSTAAERGDLPLLRKMLSYMTANDEDIQSAAVRDNDGGLLVEAGNHLGHWRPLLDGRSTLTQMQIPIFRGKERWATIEISFAPLWGNDKLGAMKKSYFSLILFVATAGLLGYYLLIKRVLRELDPTNVIPSRVQSAFNVLKEGVLILDEHERIVLANTSFADNMGKNCTELLGLHGSELGWSEHSLYTQQQLPWTKALQDKATVTGARLILDRKVGTPVTFIVNAAPVIDRGGTCRGILATFDDVTELEEKNLELNETVTKLQLTTREVQTKNKELEFLATHDPMTHLLNRRALNHKFEKVFTEAQQHGSELSCIMCDIDHFKSVNDRFGHATGDQVIIMVARLLKQNSRDTDLVGRYGGEEFCIVYPGLNIETTAKIANRIRLAVKADSASGVEVTMSFGVSSLSLNAQSPGEMTKQADKALYIAKESGRNRVVCWGTEEMSDYTWKAGTDQPAKEIGDKKDKFVIQEDNHESQLPATAYADEIKRLTVQLQEAEELAAKRSQELQYYAAYDKLTGLPTRTLFHDRILQALARGRRYDRILAILTMSVETVHRVNNTLGYKAGDQLCRAIGKRLIKTVRTVDTVAKLPTPSKPPTVFRVGQEEFGILLTDLEDVSAVTWIVKRILEAFTNAYYIDKNEVHATTNIGIAIYPYDGHSPEELQKNAAIAQKHAGKQLSGSRYCFYSENIQEDSIQHLRMETHLHRAVHNDEFVLFYQPKIDTKTGTLKGSEALIRWNDPETGLVPPNEFIPIAEYSGLIETIGHWALQTACRQVTEWLAMGIENCSVAVNFSNKQFHRKDLAVRIDNVLKDYSLDPKYLVVEVTESTMMEDINSSMNILAQIRDLGVTIALDDFGTGYSSLEYLKICPVSHLKIDRSFVADIEINERDSIMVSSIINMAHGMGLKVTAEGVENEKQADLLRQFGCDEMQGFLFGKPVPAESMVKLFAKTFK